MQTAADNTGTSNGHGAEGHASPELWAGKHLLSLAEYAMHIIMVIGPDAVIRYVNGASQRLLGYSPEEMIGRNGLDFVHPEDVEWAMQVIATSTRDPDYSEEHVIRIRHAEGGWRHLQGMGRNLLSHPEVGGIVLSFRDLTERLQMEEELRYSEELHRTLVHISPDAVIITNLQGRITFVSPLTLSMFGYESEEELLGMDGLLLIDPPDHGKVLSERKRVQHEGAARNVELNGLRKDGSKFTIEMNGAFIRDSAGVPLGLVGFVRDITARKSMERELQVRNEELEAFAHTISHDLLTPVAIVKGYAKAALEADEEGRAETERECLEAISRGAQRMSDLINSLLQYAQAGHMDMDPLGADPGEVLAEVLMDLEGGLRGGGVRLAVAEGFPRVEVGAVKLRQVFFNLISNAIRHVEEAGEPLIEVGAEVREGQAVLFVRDNGTGIPSGLHQKIFEPFRHFSLSGSSGLGIGLSTVKRAVGAWGGRVWVESKPGKGATFFFTAPLAEP